MTQELEDDTSGVIRLRSFFLIFLSILVLNRRKKTKYA